MMRDDRKEHADREIYATSVSLSRSDINLIFGA